MLISNYYANQNKLLHEQNAGYGAHSHRLVDDIARAVKAFGAKSLLDYGCGKATLAAALSERAAEIAPLTMVNYDPAMPEYSDAPEPCDMVVCSDVLEHVEPECLNDVLTDLRRLARKAALLVISTRPSGKFLPDGRNAHLIIQPVSWWMPKFRKDWTPWQTTWTKSELRTLLLPR